MAVLSLPLQGRENKATWYKCHLHSGDDDVGMDAERLPSVLCGKINSDVFCLLLWMCHG